MGALSFTVPVIFKAIDKMSSVMKSMGSSTDAFANRTERNFRKISETSKKFAKNAAVIGASVAAPLLLAANSAVAFEDKMADIAKTTGLAGKPLDDFGDSLLKMSGDTRTSLDDLLKIGEIGGQFGIAQKDLVGFTDSVNKFNVALGADFAGGVEEAVSQVSSIYGLFKQTKNLKVDEAILKIGSSINELGAQGSGTSANIAEFSVRMGGLPDAIKPAMTDVAALGTFFEENGLKAEIAAGGLTNFLLVAGKNLPGFAAQMKMSAAEATALLNKDPTEFAKRFAASTNGMSAEKLANKLHDLKIGTQETIKVIGALAGGTKRVGDLQKISNDAFEKGTSLQSEYDKKNNTTAANIKKAENNFKSLSITIGTKLLPIVGQILNKIIPFVKSIIDWTKRNPALTKTILTIAIAVSALSFALSGIAFATSLVTGTIAAWGLITKAATVIQWAWNAAMSANPIGLIIIGIFLLIAAIIIVNKHWNEWGATATAVFGMIMPPLALAIMLVQSFRRNWEHIVDSFKNGGIIEGLKAIGATLIDALLMPLSQILEIISKITGADWASSALKDVETFRKQLGANVTTEEDGSTRNAPILTTETERHEAITKMLSVERQKASLEITDNTGNAKLQSDNNIVPITLKSTKRSSF